MQNVIQLFWNKFKQSYLNELREHHMHVAKRMKTCEENHLKVGDICIIKDDKMTPRSNWRSGKVEELIIGNDKKVRGAMLRTISKEGKRTVMHRPIQKLIPLEVTSNDTVSDNEKVVLKFVDENLIPEVKH